MLVYIAAAFRRKDEMKAVASILQSRGFEITSRWIEEHPCPSDPQASLRFLRETALLDLQDITKADVIVRFSDGEVVDLTLQSVPRDLATGARHFECGFALALGKAIIVVGGKQNVFDYLPQVKHVANLNQLIQSLVG